MTLHIVCRVFGRFWACRAGCSACAARNPSGLDRFFLVTSMLCPHPSVASKPHENAIPINLVFWNILAVLSSSLFSSLSLSLSLLFTLTLSNDLTPLYIPYSNAQDGLAQDGGFFKVDRMHFVLHACMQMSLNFVLSHICICID